MLNIRQLVTGRVSLLKSVVRFNNAHRQKDESVAEHSFYVALYSLFLARHVERHHSTDLQEGLPCIHYLTLLSRALLHDLEESLSGDFPRNFKYSSEAVRSSLEDAGAVAFEAVVSELFGSREVVSHGDWARETEKDDREKEGLLSTWKDAKAGDAEGRIVALADLLSTIQYVHLEVQRGNRQILVDAKDVPGNVCEVCADRTNAKLFGTQILDEILALTKETYRDSPRN